MPRYEYLFLKLSSVPSRASLSERNWNNRRAILPGLRSWNFSCVVWWAATCPTQVDLAVNPVPLSGDRGQPDATPLWRVPSVPNLHQHDWGPCCLLYWCLFLIKDPNYLDSGPLLMPTSGCWAVSICQLTAGDCFHQKNCFPRSVNQAPFQSSEGQTSRQNTRSLFPQHIFNHTGSCFQYYCYLQSPP